MKGKATFFAKIYCQTTTFIHIGHLVLSTHISMHAIQYDHSTKHFVTLPADSTNPECFTVPMAVLVEMCYGNNKATTQLPGPSNTLAAGPTVPCPMSLLDSLTVHAKMR